MSFALREKEGENIFSSSVVPRGIFYTIMSEVILPDSISGS